MADGVDPVNAALEVGISKGSAWKLHKRLKPEVDARSFTKWNEIIKALRERMWWILDSITPESLEKATLRDKAITFGIFSEKALLFSGQPTAISSLEISDRRALPEILKAISDELERRGASKIVEGEVIQ